jgi:hypothetical protein
VAIPFLTFDMLTRTVGCNRFNSFWKIENGGHFARSGESEFRLVCFLRRKCLIGLQRMSSAPKRTTRIVRSSALNGADRSSAGGSPPLPLCPPPGAADASGPGIAALDLVLGARIALCAADPSRCPRLLPAPTRPKTHIPHLPPLCPQTPSPQLPTPNRRRCHRFPSWPNITVVAVLISSPSSSYRRGFLYRSAARTSATVSRVSLK